MSEAEKLIYTVHNLNNLIERAIMEASDFHKKNKYDITSKVLATQSRVLANHISKTIIGELFELELVRKMQPLLRDQGAWMRLVGYVAQDFKFLEDDEKNYTELINLRSPAPKEGEDPLAKG
jgi:hypothetical protein